MAQAADYFLAAMDRYEEARKRKQEMAMQQEQHALYMKNGLMQLDAFSKQQAALDQSANYIESGRASLDGLPQQASPAQQQPQQPQQPLAEAVPVPAHPSPSFDSTALQRTLSQMSGYMGDFNAARGNSGFGTALSMHRQSDGSYIIGAANPEQNGAYPLTVNPQDNGSMPLRVAPETVGPMQQYVQGRIDATGGDPAKMAALARDQFGLRHDEQGNIYVPTPDLASLPEEPAPASTAPAAPNYGPRADGTMKGNGYFGPLKMPDGRVATEIGVGVNFDGKEVEVPSLVPTLTRQEVDYLVGGGKPTPEIVKKAADHAVQRMKAGKSPFAQEGEQGALPVAAAPTPGTKTSTSTSGTTKVRFSTKVNDDPQAFHTMAQSPHLDVGPADEKVLGKVEADPFHLSTSPASVRGKTAALFLRAGLLNGEQALNMAQTGYTNMNKAQLAETMARINLTATQLKQAEHNLALDLRFGSAERQANLDNTYASIEANRASKRASEATASWQALQREYALQDRADKKQGELTNGVRTTLDRGFDSFAGKFELPKDTAANLKPQYINAVATAVQALGAEKQFTNNAGANDESRAIYERTNNLMHDPKAQEALRARGVDPTDVSQVAYYATVERYAPKRLAALDNVSKGAPSSIVRPEYATPAAVPTVKETPAANGIPLSVDDQRSLNEKNQKFVSGIVTSYFIGAPTDTESYNQKKAELQGKADSWGSALRIAYKANGIDPNKAFAADSATSVLLKATEHMDKMNVGDSQGEVEGAAVYAVATAMAGMDSSKLNSSWARDKALLSQAGVDLKAYAAKVRETVSAVQANKLQLPKGMDAATYVSETWLKPMVFKAPTKEQSPYIRPLNPSMPFRDDGTPNPYYRAQ